MTRKTLVKVIALIFMIAGFSNFFVSLLSSVLPSGLFMIRVFPLIGGLLAFYAGWTMMRFGEFGRKLAVILLSVRVAINTGLLLWLPRDGNGLAVENRLGEIIYRVDSPYAYQAFLLGLIVVALLTIIFLSQKETKEIFVSTTARNVKADVILGD